MHDDVSQNRAGEQSDYDRVMSDPDLKRAYTLGAYDAINVFASTMPMCDVNDYIADEICDLAENEIKDIINNGKYTPFSELYK